MAKAMTAAQLRGELPGYFTVADVQALPADNLFTIAFAGVEKVGVGAQQEEKPVLRLADSRKALVLNKSRANQLEALFGDDSLVGKQIRLAVEHVSGREQVVILGV